MQTILSILREVRDPRDFNARHELSAMLFIALANHLDDHCVQKRFAADAIAQKALPIIGAEDFFN